MMMPTLPSNSSSSAALASAIVRVEKATSEFLIGPDWTMNLEICDILNSNQWLVKDIVRSVKKRLLQKNPKVHLLTLTLLETMVKNCGDYVHFQIADRNVLQEMVKIVKKKFDWKNSRLCYSSLHDLECLRAIRIIETDMHVRDKILVLLDSWQEAFGGSGGKYPQYYWAYDELRRYGVEFPQRSPDAAPIFTPPLTHPPPRTPQPGYGMPSNSSTRLDEAMAAETGSLSLSSMSAMRDVLDLLADMLQALNPGDRLAVKDEVIVDLVDQCCSNQKKLMQMLTTTVDEELLGQGLELNDRLQSVLAKHDAIASGSPLPTPPTTASIQSEINNSNPKPADTGSSTTATANGNPSTSVPPVVGNQIDEEEEEEDDFAQLARRHSKTRPPVSQVVSSQQGDGGDSTSINPNSNITPPQEATSVPNNAIVLADPPAPVQKTHEQELIDLLSITLSTSMSSPEIPHQGPSSSSSSSSTQGSNPNGTQAYGGSHDQTFISNTYIAPWAQPQPQPQPQPQHTTGSYLQPHSHYYNGQPQHQVQLQPQVPQYSTAYPPPPWAATPGYFSNPNPSFRSTYAYPTVQQQSTSTATNIISQGMGMPQHQVNSVVPARGNSVSALNGDAAVIPSAANRNVAAPPAGQKPFVPSYRLFEDLNVLPNSSPSLNGSMLKGK